jgi:hypothetical protein
MRAALRALICIADRCEPTTETDVRRIRQVAGPFTHAPLSDAAKFAMDQVLKKRERLWAVTKTRGTRQPV